MQKCNLVSLLRNYGIPISTNYELLKLKNEIYRVIHKRLDIKTKLYYKRKQVGKKRRDWPTRTGVQYLALQMLFTILILDFPSPSKFRLKQCSYSLQSSKL